MIFATIRKQGYVLEVKREEKRSFRVKPAPKRGFIKEFSAKSRKRLVQLFCSLDASVIRRARQRVKFITLTYKDVQTDGETAKVHLKRFMEYLQYHYPEMWCVWRLEPQKRGAIHFHLICGNLPYIDKAFIQVVWSRSSDQLPEEINFVESMESLAKRCAFTRIEAIRSMRGVLSYASKYMTKVTSGESEESGDESLGLTMCHIFGRHWGVYGRKNLPMAENHQFGIALPENLFKWFMAKCDSPHCAPDQSFTLFCENAQMLYNVAFGLFNCHTGFWGIRDAWEDVQKVRGTRQVRQAMSNIELTILARRTTEQMKRDGLLSL